MHTVALIFAPLAPLVAALACLVFWVSSVTYKYQLMFVYTTKVESGGVSLWVIWAMMYRAECRVIENLECGYEPSSGRGVVHATLNDAK
jgi:hypothetical protein